MNEQFKWSEQPNKIRPKNLSQPIDETIRTDLIKREKEIRQQECNIQSIIFSRIYEKNLNQKVWKYLYYIWNAIVINLYFV